MELITIVTFTKQ